MKNQHVTINTLRERKASHAPMAQLTCYDYSTAQLLQEAKLELIHVGDSLGNAMLGYRSTLPVTMAEMICYGKAVCRGNDYAFISVDMPFMSYQVSAEEAVRNAGRIMKETGCQAVKLEGGREILPAVKKMIAAGIPVAGHIGLTPQSVNQLGGYKVQGKEPDRAQQLMDDARALDDAGVCTLTLECVPEKLAAKITRNVKTTTIGIGSGNACDAQVLVLQDMLGYNNGPQAKFVKPFANLHDTILTAVADYRSEVEHRQYPVTGPHTYKMDDAVLDKVE